MDNSFIILLALLLCIIIPVVMQSAKTAAARHFIKHKEITVMKDLAKQFIGKECIIYTLSGFNSSVSGTIKEVGDGGLIIEKSDGLEAVNLEYIIRIREWPRNAKGKKKTFVE